MRVGLFGGTFNPVHVGHIKTVFDIKNKYAFDRVYIIPAALPPHKKPVGIAAASHRLEMTRMAFDPYPDFTVSDVELKRNGPSYTIDTVKHFIAELGDETELFFILGIDAFLEIDTWESYKDLFDIIPLIVMTRPGKWHNSGLSDGEAVERYLINEISDQYAFSGSEKCCVHKKKKPVFVSEVTPFDISATKIRKCIKEGKKIGAFVPGKVHDYIKKKGLYV
jgi:nicotinate-nucleotide adenylyltransferase